MGAFVPRPSRQRLGCSMNTHRLAIDLDAAQQAIEACRLALERQPHELSDTPARTIILPSTPPAVLGVMGAYSPSRGRFVTKSAVALSQESTNRPTVSATVAIFSTYTGEVLYHSTSAQVTKVKTIMSVGVTTDACASIEASTVAIIGAGEQAESSLLGVAAVRNIRVVHIWSRKNTSAHRLSRTIRRLIPEAEVLVHDELGDSAWGADIICTATASTRPLWRTVDFFREAHVNCVGGHTTAERELPRTFLSRAHVITEEREQAERELGSDHQQAQELTELILLGTEDREHLREQHTVFSSAGHPFLDLLAAVWLYEEENY